METLLDEHTLSETLGNRIKAQDIVAALYSHYSRKDWLAFHELRIGTGFGKDADQRIDFWVMQSMPSKAFRRVAFEIKVSRSDFLNEMRNPLKRRYALLLSNEFYFATPPGLIKADELPVEAGLVELHVSYSDAISAGDRDNYKLGEYGASDAHLHFRHAAPWRETHPPSWRFVAGAIRRALTNREQQYEAEASSIAAALVTYGRHLPECNATPCTCGFHVHSPDCRVVACTCGYAEVMSGRKVK